VTQLDPDLLALQEVRDYSERAWRACEAVHSFSQEQVDALCKSMAEAGARAAYDLAKLAVEETGIGASTKVLKNLFGSGHGARSRTSRRSGSSRATRRGA
jgi:acetaldehyde dehydrogenase (acetylating)